ncbi:Histone acetyltransferase ESA1 [Trichinella pseudospiralis]|uniref:histone acetyltransferase n=1 Tax=Trichinella pseudospiralis TaxID=6337 RepID=A0A0V1F6I4_TRIPS|nr:Histone acetyltransferase ESA1 [Trichinella pseudospiralis]
MKTVQEHFLNTSKALKPTENGKIIACVFIIARQFQQEGYGGLLIELSMRYLYADNEYISLCTLIFEFGYVLSRKEHRTCTPERPFSVERLAAYQRYWLQSIVEYMAQKGTKWQFDIIELLKLSGISDVGIAAKLFTYDMLANVHEEYWIVISEEKRIGLESYDLPKSLVDPAKTEEEIENSLASIL